MTVLQGEASSFQLCAYVNSADICALVAETKNGPTYVDVCMRLDWAKYRLT